MLCLDGRSAVVLIILQATLRYYDYGVDAESAPQQTNKYVDVRSRERLRLPPLPRIRSKERYVFRLLLCRLALGSPP